MDPVLARIQGLEKERWLYRVLVLLGALAGLAGAGVAVMASFSEQESAGAVRSLTVVDGNRRSRIELKIDPGSGQPWLVLKDELGNDRQLIRLSKAGDPEVVLLSSERKPRAAMSVTVDGSPQMSLFDPSGNQRATLSVSIGTYDPKFELFGPDGRTPQLSITAGSSGASIVDAAGNRIPFTAP